jgi:predicted acylesterase/phospholipase RssA
MRLSQFFDYIGGTSTGAILAAGLAAGHSCKYLLSFYEDFGRKVFEARSIFERWKSLYDDGELRTKLQVVFGERGRSAEAQRRHDQGTR